MMHLRALRMAGAAGTLLAALFTSTDATAKGGHPAEPGDAQSRAQSREVTHGRAIIFRAGQLPRLAPAEAPREKTHAAPTAHPTHYLDTTLPVLIQGAPDELVLRRHVNTG